MKTSANDREEKEAIKGKNYTDGTCSDFKFTSSRSEQKVINVSLINLIESQFAHGGFSPCPLVFSSHQNNRQNRFITHSLA